MKISILDGFTLNPGDLSWQGFSELGIVSYYDRTEPNIEIYINRCIDAEVIIINKAGLKLGDSLFEKLPQLKLILVTATGYNIIDTAAAKKYGITVCNVPGYSTHAVAQLVFALILELNNRVGDHNNSVKKGDWVNAADWCYGLQPIHDLAGKKLGIIGLGNIGKQVKRIAQAFDMTVLAHNESRNTGIILTENCYDLDELISESDFISLHCPATDLTTGMVNAQFLSKMKKSAYLINTSRGQLVHDEDLNEALNKDVIAGAGIDVFAQEPPLPQNPLLSNEKCIITPHIGWMSVEARQRCMKITLENLKAFMAGQPQNVVS